MGHPIGEALLPSLITFFLFQYTWREIWVGIGTCIIIIFLPLVYWLGRHIKLNKHDSYNSKQTKSKKNLIVSWNRSQVLKDLRFYQVLPGLLASPFIVTGVFFHQIHLIETKSWSITLLASSYPFFALSVIGVTFRAGWIIDRFGTVHLLCFFVTACIWFALNSSYRQGICYSYIYDLNGSICWISNYYHKYSVG